MQCSYDSKCPGGLYGSCSAGHLRIQNAGAPGSRLVPSLSNGGLEFSGACGSGFCPDTYATSVRLLYSAYIGFSYYLRSLCRAYIYMYRLLGTHVLSTVVAGSVLCLDWYNGCFGAAYDGNCFVNNLWTSAFLDGSYGARWMGYGIFGHLSCTTGYCTPAMAFSVRFCSICQRYLPAHRICLYIPLFPHQVHKDRYQPSIITLCVLVLFSGSTYKRGALLVLRHQS